MSDLGCCLILGTKVGTYLLFFQDFTKALGERDRSIVWFLLGFSIVMIIAFFPLNRVRIIFPNVIVRL